MAGRLQVDPTKLMESLKHTAFRGASNEEMLALVVVANQYGLNPFLKQLYAFPAKGGGIVPMVSIDGWASIVNQNPGFDGVEFEFADENGRPASCTCVMHVRGRAHPVRVTEYYAECFRSTEPWKAMPRRMLRHKAYIQAARLAFSLGGIYDEDEARDMIDVPASDVAVTQEPAQPKRPKAASLADRLKAAAPISADTETVNVDTGEVTQGEVVFNEDPALQHATDDPTDTAKTFRSYDEFRTACISLVAGTDVTEDQIAKWMGGQVIALGKKGKEHEIPAEVLVRWYQELKSGKAKL